DLEEALPLAREQEPGEEGGARNRGEEWGQALFSREAEEEGGKQDSGQDVPERGGHQEEPLPAAERFELQPEDVGSERPVERHFRAPDPRPRPPPQRLGEVESLKVAPVDQDRIEIADPLGPGGR